MQNFDEGGGRVNFFEEGSPPCTNIPQPLNNFEFGTPLL